MKNNDPVKLLNMVNGIIQWKSPKKGVRNQRRIFLRKVRLWMDRVVKEKEAEKGKEKEKEKEKEQVTEIVNVNVNVEEIVKEIVKEIEIVNGKEPLKFVFSSPDEPEYIFENNYEISRLRVEEDNQQSGTKIDIFRFPIIEWDYRWQRPQQLSVQFAEDGHRVFYFSIEMHPVASHTATFEEIAQQVVVRELRSNVWWVKICSHNPLNCYQSVIRDPLDMKYIHWSIKSLKAQFHIETTLSILDLPFWTPIAFNLNNNKTLYDCMDEHSGFSHTSSELLTLERTLLEKADMVIASSQELFKKAIRLNPCTALIRNAGEYGFFSQPPARIASELEGLKRPIIGYIGAIAEWFDVELIEYLAVKNKEWTFFFVGSTQWSDTAALEQLDNVIFVGEKPYSELSSYLYGFDVCLIPFLKNNLTTATNPVKVYEYLASGKPVVSVRLPELDLMEEYIHLAMTPEQFEQAIQSALYKESDDLIKKRKDFAAEHTWQARYTSLKMSIHQELYPKVSIIIVTYNNWSYTKSCLDSVFKHSYYPNYEVIVVDNASTDETRKQLAKIRNEQLKIVLSPVNSGFAGGNSIGCQIATGEYIILLNNDTLVPPGWIQRLTKPLQDPEIGLAGPMSNSVGNDQRVDHFVGDPVQGANPDWLKEFYSFYKDRVRSTDLLGFYCVAMRKAVYDEVGGLDTQYNYGMFEDDDYCARVKKLRFKLVIVEDAFVYHHGSASFNKLDEDEYQAIFTRNKQYFEQKWERRWQPHKTSLSLFSGISDAASITREIEKAGKKNILVLGKKEWSFPKENWQYSAQVLCKDENLVIGYVQTYHDQKIEGIRKVGPSFYLTDQISVFEKTVFDIVLYCGETSIHQNLQAKYIVIDAASYNAQGAEQLETELNVTFLNKSRVKVMLPQKLENL